MVKISSLLILVLLFVASLPGQKVDKVANVFVPDPEAPEALSIPKPDFPEEIRKAKRFGWISVPVKIDSQGKVIETGPASGPGYECESVSDPTIVAMRRNAVFAARSATFKPPKLNPPSTTVEADLIFGFEKDGVKVMHPVKRVPRVLQDNAVDVSISLILISQSKPIQVSELPAGSLPRPSYSKRARELEASGPVQVEVTFDNEGKVYSAQSKSGHRVLMKYAEAAACKADIPRSLLSPAPPKTATIVYDFILK